MLLFLTTNMAAVTSLANQQLFSRNNATLNLRHDLIIVCFFFNVFRTQQAHKQGKACALHASYNNHMMVINLPALYTSTFFSVNTQGNIYYVQLAVEECHRSKEKKTVIQRRGSQKKNKCQK